MSIVRIKKRESPYLVIDVSGLRDASMSWKAKGLHAYLMTLPDDWRVNIADLQNRSSDGRESVRSAIAELIKRGYISRERSRMEDGTMGDVEYTVYEVPDLLPGIAAKVGKPDVGLSDVGKPYVGKPDATKYPEKEVTNKPTAEPKPDRTWMRKYFSMWHKNTGGALIPAKWLLDALRELEASHGADTVSDAFDRYSRSPDSKWGPKQFVQGFGRWVVKKHTASVDANGD